MKRPRIIAEPASRARWKDLVSVFGEHGAYAGCWCAYWRVKRSEFDGMGGKARRAMLLRLTRRRRPPGIIYYDTSGGETAVPFAWCSLEPREDFPVLARSHVLKPVDELPTWSVVCFFTAAPYRGRGIFRELVGLAVEYARENGAQRVEAYPREGEWTGMPAYMGIAEVYRSIGFREIARRKPDRPVLRLDL